MPTSARRTAAIMAAVTAIPVSLIAGAATASATTQTAATGFTAKVIINGAKLSHTFTPAGSSTPKTEPLTSPDDITVLGHDIFTAFQNGVGPQGQASTDGNTDSTVVEFTPAGQVIHQWDIHGKCDGITADRQRNLLVADVNEDAHSSVYTISPSTSTVLHYQYSVPLPSKGGTDAISFWHGMTLISASAPGTTGKAAPRAAYPAVYKVTFNSAKLIATVTPLFYDEATATVANTGKGEGKKVKLALTDPDSNEDVPSGAPRFAGDFMLTSQGDQEQIFYSPSGKLQVLHLPHSVDDTAWIRSASGALFLANTGGGTIDEITGPFKTGTVFAAVTPCDQNDAPSTCPAAGFPANYLGQINPWTGALTKVKVSGPSFGPQGMVFIAPGWNVWPG
jgi:hypothetical protein